MFNYLFIYLQKHTEIGVASTIISFLISISKSTMPALQFCSAIIFLLIGVFTLVEKIKTLFKKKS